MVYNIAHRGYSSKYPENTLLAFQKALEANCDGMELDLQLTKDGEVVIFHDEELGRTIQGFGHISDYTLQELQEKNASILFSTLYGAQIIPTLDDYFTLIENTEIFSVLELKKYTDSSPGLEEKVISTIEKHGVASRVILSSFSRASIRICQAMAPHIKTALISDSWFFKSYQRAKREDVDYLNLRYEYLQFSWVYVLIRREIPIMVWTVNHPKKLRRLAKSKVYAIMTNDPKTLHEILEENKKQG